VRIRTIKPSFFTDEEIAALEPLDRIAFMGLWCEADREGRLEARPLRLKSLILPYDEGDFEARLTRLQDAGFIQMYLAEFDGKHRQVIQVVNFTKHQRPHHTEPDSVIPDMYGERSVTSRSTHGGFTDGREGKGKEGKGSMSFAKFWESYPRKVGREDALKAWLKLEKAEMEIALEAVRTFGEVWRLAEPEQKKFCPHGSTWLNQKRFYDDPVEWKRAAGVPMQPERREETISEAEAELRRKALEVSGGE
jgi:hypothetical protein